MLFYLLLLVFAPVLSIPVNLIALLRRPNSEKAFKHAIFFSFGFAYIANFIVPDMEMDLYRYYLRMDEMKSLGTLDAIQQEISSFNTEFISYYLMYIISKTDIYCLYTAISVAYTYGVCLCILLKICISRNYTANETRITILILLTWLSSSAIVSGIRYNMAFTTLLLAFYFEYSLKLTKVVCIPIYFITLLIHSSFIIFVLLRILLSFCLRYKILRYIVFGILATWSLYFGNLADIANDLSFYNDGYLSEKLEDYSNVHEGGRIGHFIVRYAKLLVCFLISFILIRKSRSDDREKFSIEIYNIFNSLLVIGSFSRLLYVSRFFQVLTSFVPFYIIEILKDSDKQIKMLTCFIIAISSMIFLYDQQSTLGMRLSKDFLSLFFRPIFLL